MVGWLRCSGGVDGRRWGKKRSKKGGRGEGRGKEENEDNGHGRAISSGGDDQQDNENGLRVQVGTRYSIASKVSRVMRLIMARTVPEVKEMAGKDDGEEGLDENGLEVQAGNGKQDNRMATCNQTRQRVPLGC